MPSKFLQNITPREYQQKIFETCVKKNCLVVLPTGLGKTLIALMLVIDRMQKFPTEKIVFLAPTKPLIEQHINSFQKNLPELFADMQLFTGAVKPEKRKQIWKTADIVFSTPQCVIGNTMVFTKKGPVEIKELFSKFKFHKKGKYEIANIKEKILGYDKKKITFLNASKAIKISHRKLLKLKTELGNELACTKDHPLMTLNSNGEVIWKTASGLKKGEHIASAKRIEVPEKEIKTIDLIKENKSLKVADKNLTKTLIQKLKQNKIKTAPYSRYYYNFMPIELFLKLSKKINFKFRELILTDKQGKSSFVKLPQKLDFELSYIIGAFLGDGHIGNRKGHGKEVVFSDLDRKSVNEKIKKTMQKLFGIKMKENPKGLITYNSALASILSSFGIPKGNKSKKTRVPKYLFFAKQEAVKGFIKGIFDTDGSSSKHSVSISSASKKFIQELEWLFLRIGITGNTETRKSSKSFINGRKIKESEIFTFRFSGRENLLKFLEVKPDKDKCKKLIETLKKTKRPLTRSKDILPVPELMKKIRRTNKGATEYYRFLCMSKNNLKNISKNLKGKDAQKLKQLLDMPVRWVKIKEKKELKETQEVFDLTIDAHHNFIANSLINHNCVANDLRKKLYNLENVSLLIEDEAHRCMKNYDYNFLSEQYQKQAAHPRILGLTASPGSEASKIKEICKNLSIEEVELRDRESDDVKQYLQKREFKKIEVAFPPEFQEIKHVLLKLFDSYIEELRTRKVLFGPASKTNLIKLQKNIMSTLARGNKNFNYMLAASACAQAVKLQHALELLETQTLASFNKYLKELFNQASKKQSKGVVKLVARPEFNFTFMQSNELLAKNQDHPKIEKLVEIVEKEFSEMREKDKQKNFSANNPASAFGTSVTGTQDGWVGAEKFSQKRPFTISKKILNPKSKTPKLIIFTQYRETAKTISKKLNEIKNVKSKVFVGQAKKNGTGLNQKQQKKIIQDFSDGKINILVATCIAEEGLDIPEVNEVIFYEPISSAIRSIQRAGRTARLMKGKLIILITKGTRDETFYYISRSREKKMQKVITNIKEDLASGKLNLKERQEGLN